MTVPPSGWPNCGYSVSWWDGEYEGYCELRFDHPENMHHDGMSWYNDVRDLIYLEDALEDYIRCVYGPPKGLIVL